MQTQQPTCDGEALSTASNITAATQQDTPLRSLAKAVSWRVTGSLDTIMLSWFFTQQLAVAVAIGTTEVITKVVLYYVHERVWNRIPLGLR
jgi:uncharacterized membrane protein